MKNTASPMMSFDVVMNGPVASAGSMPTRSSRSGIVAPSTVAITITMRSESADVSAGGLEEFLVQSVRFLIQTCADRYGLRATRDRIESGQNSFKILSSFANQLKLYQNNPITFSKMMTFVAEKMVSGLCSSSGEPKRAAWSSSSMVRIIRMVAIISSCNYPEVAEAYFQWITQSCSRRL